MRLLIFGAGVLGTFYAAKLQACGHDVTILARGRRAVQVRDYGLVVQERERGCLRARASVIETLGPDQSYDYVLVLVRNEQVESVLPSLAANKATPSLVFMFNNLAGPQPLIQKTTVGELDGLRTPRVRLLAAALQEAGFPTAISSNMDAWLKTHVALVSPIADALYAAGGDLKILAASRFQVFAMLRSIRKAFAALRAQGLPVTPARLRSVELLPAWLLVGARPNWLLAPSQAPTASPLRSLLPWRWGLRHHPGKSPLVKTALPRLSERQTPLVPAPSARSPAAARAPRVRSRAVAAMAEAA